MLVLFDIDGTLLREGATPVGGAMSAALRELHGVRTSEIRTRIETSGRTHGEIARAILLHAGVPGERIDALAGAVCDLTCQAWAQDVPEDLSGSVLPGVGELLHWLGGLPELRLALLTGNYEAIAWLKLERAGIADWFERGQGAFGSDADDRDALPAIARRRAGTSRAPYPREQTIVIGDTPKDIACARADRVRSVAVASGSFGVEALADGDVVVRDAAALRVALQELLSRPAG
jgi:phosphoglycolate phosphatase-like HAD superfamily hydrolase